MSMRHWRLFLMVGILIGAALGYHFGGLKQYFDRNAIDVLRGQVLEMGALGVLAFMAVYIFFVTFGIPNLPLQLMCGAIYGMWPAYAMMYVGVNIGALTAFSMGRFLGRKGIEELWGHRLKGLNAMIERGGFRLLLILRLLPLMPFNSINYGSGISRIRVKTYMAATVLGTIPLTFLHVTLGDAAGTLDLTKAESWLSPKVLPPLLLAGGLMVFALGWGRLQQKRTR